MLIAAKLAIPLAMATVGAGAATVAVVTQEPSTATTVSTASQVWIDAPTGDEAVAPGTVHVGAHATAEGSIGSLVLYVDGKEVATDSTLERNEKLVYGSFDWKASEGEHELVVAQPASDRRSVPVDLLVTGDPDATTTSTSTTTSTTIAGSTTSTSSTTTSTTAPGETTTTGSPMVTTPGGGTIPPPVTAVPTTRPPTTVPPTQPAPIIDGAGMNGTTVYRLNCGYPDITVTARARNATSAAIIVEGTGFNRAMSRSGASFTGTIPSGIWGAGDVGQHSVTVAVTGPGGRAEESPGTIDIRMSCPKD